MSEKEVAFLDGRLLSNQS